MECFFCEVLNKKVGVFEVYENENFLAFVDAFPFVPGQIVIITKKHSFSFINFEIFSKDFFDVIKKIVTSFLNLGYDGYHLLINEGSAATFDHFYCILIPRKKDDGFSFNLKKLNLNEKQMSEISELIKKNIKEEEKVAEEKKEEKEEKEKVEDVEEVRRFLEKIKRIP